MTRIFVILLTLYLFLFAKGLGQKAVAATGNKIKDKNTIENPPCHPEPNPKASHYIIGYGSLISSASKNLTSDGTRENMPVLIQGYRRSWNLKGVSKGPSTTFLGVLADDKANFNGVIFRIPRMQNVTEVMTSYDRRESFYCRRQVNQPKIQFLSSRRPGGENKFPAGHHYWIYVNKPEFTQEPTKNYPIVQSYVDIFITGCIEQEEKFGLKNYVEDCVTTTSGWSKQFWVNDRIFPRRPFFYQPKAGKIDTTLQKLLPEHFANIKFEGMLK